MFRHLSRQLRQHLISRLALLLAVAVYFFPLQRYLTLARFQHYGLAFFVLGMGHVLEAVWSWSRLRKWARAGFLGTGIYMCLVGITFWSNPWLDTRAAALTDTQESLRQLLSTCFAAMSVCMLILWTLWLLEEYGMKKSL